MPHRATRVVTSVHRYTQQWSDRLVVIVVRKLRFILLEPLFDLINHASLIETKVNVKVTFMSFLPTSSFFSVRHCFQLALSGCPMANADDKWKIMIIIRAKIYFCRPTAFLTSGNSGLISALGSTEKVHKNTVRNYFLCTSRNVRSRIVSELKSNEWH